MPDRPNRCQICHSPLVRTTDEESNVTRLVMATLFFLSGLLVYLAMPGATRGVGVMSSVGAVVLGTRRKEVWRCEVCGAVEVRRGGRRR